MPGPVGRALGKVALWFVPNRVQHFVGLRKTPLHNLQPWNIPRSAFEDFGDRRTQKVIERGLIKAGYTSRGFDYRGDRIREYESSPFILKRYLLNHGVDINVSSVIDIVKGYPIRTETQGALFSGLVRAYAAEDQIIANPWLTVPLNFTLATTVTVFKLLSGIDFLVNPPVLPEVLGGVGVVAAISLASLHWAGKSFFLLQCGTSTFNLFKFNGIFSNLNWFLGVVWSLYFVVHGSRLSRTRQLVANVLEDNRYDKFCLDAISILEATRVGRRTLGRLGIEVKRTKGDNRAVADFQVNVVKGRIFRNRARKIIFT